MSNIEYTYDLEENKSVNDLKFFFISKGDSDIIKAIQYSFVHDVKGKQIYNLGFGDYDLERDKIVDDVNSNNGDAHKVFNTVLNSIPIFFHNFPTAILMVQGSDGRLGFIDNCRPSCRKNCMHECKNYNRRINIYRKYIDKNYDVLKSDFHFFGGFNDLVRGIAVETYQCGKIYDSVFIKKK